MWKIHEGVTLEGYQKTVVPEVSTYYFLTNCYCNSLMYIV